MANRKLKTKANRHSHKGKGKQRQSQRQTVTRKVSTVCVAVYRCILKKQSTYQLTAKHLISNFIYQHHLACILANILYGPKK